MTDNPPNGRRDVRPARVGGVGGIWKQSPSSRAWQLVELSRCFPAAAPYCRLSTFVRPVTPRTRVYGGAARSLGLAPLSSPLGGGTSPATLGTEGRRLRPRGDPEWTEHRSRGGCWRGARLARLLPLLRPPPAPVAPRAGARQPEGARRSRDAEPRPRTAAHPCGSRCQGDVGRYRGGGKRRGVERERLPWPAPSPFPLQRMSVWMVDGRQPPPRMLSGSRGGKKGTLPRDRPC